MPSPLTAQNDWEETFAAIAGRYTEVHLRLSTDPLSAATRARQVIEAIAEHLHTREIGVPGRNDMLDARLKRLDQKGVIPRHIAVYFGTVQIHANNVIHAGPDLRVPSPEELEPCVKSLDFVVDWFFQKYLGRSLPRPPAEPGTSPEAKVTLRVIRGPLDGKAFEFDSTDTFLFGRSQDCHGRIPEADGHASRYHFLLETCPPQVRLRDLGSLNGTFINGKKSGGRGAHESPAEAAKREFPRVELADGDRIDVGETSFEVRVRRSAVASPTIGSHGYQPGAATKPAGERQAASDVDRLIGDLVGERGVAARTIAGYTIERELGRGGMGAVLLARRHGDGRAVALKLLLPRVPADARGADQFLREATLALQLKHVNVVETHELGRCEGFFFVAMELCTTSVEGLASERGGRIGLTESTPIILGALDGLDHAHHAPIEVKLADGSRRSERGIVHRDIKPANILLTGGPGHWTSKLADYGLAKCFNTAGLSGHTMTGVVGGTPYFMPREQLINYKRLQPVSDVWAMGATLYNMLTGSTPYDFSEGRDPIAVILTSEAVPVRARMPELDPRVAAVIDQAVMSNPDHRFPTARKLRDALASVLP